MKTLITIIICCFLISIESNETNTFDDKRDGQTYSIIEVNGLKWFGENLNFETENSRYFSSDSTVIADCGRFYNVHDALKVCPEGWRLPTKKEVKKLVKYAKKNKKSVREILNINLCGRVGYERASKFGTENTYWLNEPLENEFIEHWHIFGDEISIHNHNVIVVDRKFPVRCVCEITE